MKKELEIFDKYYNKYSVIKEIDKKRTHSHRVAKYSEKIAKSLNYRRNDIDLAIKCGLLHDIGRVPQFYYYKTYNDEISIDHGDAGYDLLKDENYDNETVLNAVKYHNKYEISKDLSEKDTKMCNIVRDADKLDIMFTQGLELEGDNYDISDDIINCFKNHQMVHNCHETNDLYMILRLLAFIFDFNYEFSFKYVRGNNLIENKMNIIRKKISNEKVDLIENILNEYIDDRLKNKDGVKHGRIR